MRTVFAHLLVEYIDTISYDALGNPLNWYNNTATFSNITWEGRKLTGMTVGSTAYTFSYNSDGIRTKKQNGSNVVEYLYDDYGNLVEEKHGNYSLYFIYDDSNELIGFKVSNGGTYYYGKDVFGVIKYIYNASGTIVGTYTYDAWGNTISSTGTTDTNLNPIRYKDYYFDTESGFYYLQSRYYDPQVGRFISADDTGYLGATGTILSFNLYVICENSPSNRNDPNGHYSYKTNNKTINKLIEIILKIIPNIYSDDIKSKTIFEFGTKNLYIKITVGAALQTNKNAIWGGMFKKGTLEISSFLGITNNTCFSFSTGISFSKAYIKFGLLIALSNIPSGAYVGAYIELSVPTWLLAVATVATAAISVYNPVLGGYVIKTLATIKTGIRVAAPIVAPLVPLIIVSIM